MNLAVRDLYYYYFNPPSDLYAMTFKVNNIKQIIRLIRKDRKYLTKVM